ncbi:MAG: PEGA domain-containing protein [Candidatus Saccharimonadales bacterium]
MYHAPSKQKQLIQRTVVYSIMTLAVITLVSILLLFMLGYRFNQADGRIEQGGLVQFDSRPNGATVGIDNKAFGTRTASKATLTSGQHFITMEKPGYERWQKSVNVLAGSVLWIDYARLVPLTLQPSTVAQFKTVTSTASSTDKNWMAIVTDPTLPVLQLADISQDAVKVTSLALPATSYTAATDKKTQRFSLGEWDSSSRYVTVKYTYDDKKVEWLVVDTQRPSQTRNISTMLGIAPTAVVFSPTDRNKLYVKTANEVRQVNLNNQTLSGPLVSNITEFTVYKNTLLFTTQVDKTTKTRAVGYYDESAGKARTLRTYAGEDAQTLHVAVGEYIGDTYVALAHGETVEVMLGDLPRSDSADVSSATTLATMTIPGGVKFLSVQTSGRFVVAQSTNGYTVYDVELKKTTTTPLHADEPVTRPLNWIDGYNVVSDQAGMLRMYEFDGANQHDIMPVAAGFDATLSRKGTYLYAITQTADKQYELIRVRMILP